MTRRDGVAVKQLKLTPQQMKETVARATENSKSWVRWKDPHKEQDMLDLGPIKKRIQAATDGPWEVKEEFDIEQVDVDMCEKVCIWRGVYSKHGGLNHGEEVEMFEQDDADFIAESRTDIPSLVAEVERVRAELAKAQRDLATVNAVCKRWEPEEEMCSAAELVQFIRTALGKGVT